MAPLPYPSWIQQPASSLNITNCIETPVTNKTTWDTSNANEIGQLCQGIGSGSAPTGQWLAGTNTFYIIDYKDIPSHNIRSAKQDDIYGASNIALPCPSS
jgi:hypothetical protein